MQSRRLFFFLLSLLYLATVSAEPLSGERGTADKAEEIDFSGMRMNNRILLKINGKAITVMDLAKKLDLLFYRQYPHLADVPQAKYQFYNTSWHAVLDMVIDDELMLADAKEKKINVTDGEVREEMETLFGPDVVGNLNKLDWTYEEAVKILRDQLIVRRMTQMMVRSKATISVQPSEVRKLYNELVANEKPQQVWIYQTITLEAALEAQEQAWALGCMTQVFEELSAGVLTQEAAINGLKKRGFATRLATLERKETELSDAHRQVLKKLQTGEYSPPIVSEKKEGVVIRLFHLENIKMTHPPSFAEMEKKLNAHLMQQAIGRETRAYVDKLRTVHGVTQDYLAKHIPSDFQPFIRQSSIL